MEKILNNIFTILIMNGAILLIPGVNFLLIAKHSLLSGFSVGMRCAMGITGAIMFHVILSAFSISVLLKNYPALFELIRYGGAAYLIYLGTCFLISAYRERIPDSSAFSSLDIKTSEAFRAGFFVDLLNPFVSIFYLSLFSTLMMVNGSLFELTCYALTIFVITFSWFGFVAFFFAQKRMQGYFQGKNHYIQVLSGIAMYYFSCKVIFGL